MSGRKEAAPAVGLRKVVDQSPDMAAIGNLLTSIEGMQEQLMALTEIVVQQDKRILQLQKRLEKVEFGAAPVVDIRGRIKGAN